jgi:hypothetical protein
MNKVIKEQLTRLKGEKAAAKKFANSKTADETAKLHMGGFMVGIDYAIDAVKKIAESLGEKGEK